MKYTKHAILVAAIVFILCNSMVSAELNYYNASQRVVITDNDYIVEEQFDYLNPDLPSEVDEFRTMETYAQNFDSNIDGDMLYYYNTIDNNLNLINITSKEDIAHYGYSDVSDSNQPSQNMGAYEDGQVLLSVESIEISQSSLADTAILLTVEGFNGFAFGRGYSWEDILPSFALDLVDSSDLDYQIQHKYSDLVGSKLVVSFLFSAIGNVNLMEPSFANFVVILDPSSLTVEYSHIFGYGETSACPQFDIVGPDAMNYNYEESSIFFYNIANYCYVDLDAKTVSFANFTESLELRYPTNDIYYHNSSMIAYFSDYNELTHHYYNSDRSPDNEIIDFALSLENTVSVDAYGQGFIIIDATIAQIAKFPTDASLLAFPPVLLGILLVPILVKFIREKL